MYNVLFSRAISYAKQCDLYAISAPSDVNMIPWTKVVVFRHAGQRLFFAGQRKSNGSMSVDSRLRGGTVFWTFFAVSFGG